MNKFKEQFPTLTNKACIIQIVLYSTILYGGWLINEWEQLGQWVDETPVYMFALPLCLSTLIAMFTTALSDITDDL